MGPLRGLRLGQNKCLPDPEQQKQGQLKHDGTNRGKFMYRHSNFTTVPTVTPNCPILVDVDYEFQKMGIDQWKKLFIVIHVIASLCGLVGKDFVYHACGHEFESRLK